VVTYPSTTRRPGLGQIGRRTEPRTLVLLTALATLVGLLLYLRANQPPVRLKTHPVAIRDITVLNQGTVSVTVHVTNDGTTAVIPTCLVDAADASGRDQGSGTFALQSPIQPRQTGSFTAAVPITGLGAESVTHASATCQ
jgi:hypothetical protein